MADITAVEGDTAIRIDFDLEDAYGPIALASTTVTCESDAGSTATTVTNPVTGIGYFTLPAIPQGHSAATIKVVSFSNEQFFPSNRDLTVLILPHTRAR